MSAGTSIQWATDTWNVLSGCTKVSRGCQFCYAARLAATRLKHTEKYEGLAQIVDGVPRWLREVRVTEEALLLPFGLAPGKEEPRRIFVNSMSDLFHEDVPDEIILKHFDVMAATPYHRYLILTKRPERMERFSRRLSFRPTTDEFSGWATDFKRRNGPKGLTRRAVLADGDPPLANVALGVSVEGRAEFASRVPWLRHTKAALRFLSVEPLVEDISEDIDLAFGGLSPVDWVIVGGESGKKSKIAAFDLDWAAKIADETARHGKTFFFKQPGDKPLLRGKAVIPEFYSRDAMDRFPDSGRLILPGDFPRPFFDYSNKGLDHRLERGVWLSYR